MCINTFYANWKGMSPTQDSTATCFFPKLQLAVAFGDPPQSFAILKFQGVAEHRLLAVENSCFVTGFNSLKTQSQWQTYEST